MDASALVEWLLATERGHRVHDRIGRAGVQLHAPALVDVEVVSGLRRAVGQGAITAERGRGSIDVLLSLELTRHPVPPLLPRVWDLRDSLSAYDATYVALAEALDMRLLTCDGRLARSQGGSADVHLV